MKGEKNRGHLRRTRENSVADILKKENIMWSEANEQESAKREGMDKVCTRVEGISPDTRKGRNSKRLYIHTYYINCLCKLFIEKKRNY